MKRRILVVLGASILAISLGFGGREVAYAQSGTAFCGYTNECMNAWGGGPNINVNNGVTANDYFAVSQSGNDYNIYFTGSSSSPYALDCIGDAGNSPTDARAALSQGNGQICPTAPWGGVFTERLCLLPNATAGVAFYDTHWKGYLGPASGGNGAAFYLNSTNPICFDLS